MKNENESGIVWEQREVKLAELKPNERNPRTITKEQFERLKASLAETGYHARLTCDADLSLLGGHMRLKAMEALGIDRAVVLVPSRKLTPEERQRIAVQDNLAFGEWDMDILGADFNIDDLREWGMGEDALKFAIGSDSSGLTDPDATSVSNLIECPSCGHSFKAA